MPAFAGMTSFRRKPESSISTKVLEESNYVHNRKFSGIKKTGFFRKNPVFLKTLHSKIYGDLLMEDYDKIHRIWDRAHSAGSPIKFVRNTCVYRELENLSPGHTLDAGCGTGEYSIFLAELGHMLTAFDPSSFAVKKLKDKTDKASMISAEENTIDKFYSSIKFDNIISIEVLEHIKFDHAAVRKLYSLLKNGGTLVISTPANPFLFSEGDRVSGHYRRYTYAELKKLLTEAGFNHIAIKSYGFPVLFIYSLLKKIFLDKILINRFSSASADKGKINFLYKYYPIIFAMDQLDLPYLGVGYVAVCKK